MAYQCEQCRETTTFGEVFSTITKLAVLGAVGYLVFNYRSDLKAIVEQTVKKTRGSLNGNPRRIKRK